MSITKLHIRKAIDSAEINLHQLWGLLCDLKSNKIHENNFGNRLISFQENLASTIFDLQIVRDKIIKEEKLLIDNKNRFNYNWFKGKMKLLSNFKKAIDYVINISRAFGDSYAFFFYQFDLKLLAKHLSHQRITNYTTSIGRRGELELIKKIKHVDGNFLLFHDITNILRYGDCSFIDLRTMKIAQIGELKTSIKEENVLNLELLIVDREVLKNRGKPLHNPNSNKTRKDRQLLGIINLLINEIDPNSTNISLDNKSYSKEIELLLKNARTKRYNFVKVSDGLAFVCIKYKKTTLYNRIFTKNNSKDELERHKQRLFDTALSLMKPPPAHNSLVIGQLLYESDLSSKNLSGTIPLFWQPIDTNLLKDIYFTTCMVSSIFNPIHLIEKVESMGYKVDSKYINNGRYKEELQKSIQHFDSFIPHVIDHLLTENFVFESLRESEKFASENNLISMTIKPQRHVNPD
ncbi:hypothetical protein BN8_03970 [Fibrisoma limi BUZ 3]|uniref:Uncharacterized protein n=1 Tax=Fibrisoma limi BUZ 3 TaxID=1185876 RepID=I2GLJ1_9BACT|nr:hypothetical protein [Fibrisoma limi]CCH54767.1 hypothetical protein BN8_03970 [Fibrisoma limi BUZ 3]